MRKAYPNSASRKDQSPSCTGNSQVALRMPLLPTRHNIFRHRFQALEKNVETPLKTLCFQGLEKHRFQRLERMEINFRNA
jgi:hypothetical protein